MFMLRMIGANSGDFVCTQVLHNLWKLFLCKKCSSHSASKSESAAQSENRNEGATEAIYNLNFDVHTSEFEEEDEQEEHVNKPRQSIYDKNTDKKSKPKTKMPQPQLKSIMSRKKSSLIGRLFSEVTSKTQVKTATPPPKSRSIHLMHQQKKMAKSSHHQPQARDERFSIEMKRFQSIKRITHPANRRSRPNLETTEIIDE